MVRGVLSRVRTGLCMALVSASFALCQMLPPQDSGDLAFLLCTLDTGRVDRAKPLSLVPAGEVHDLKIVSFGMIRLYQKFISSQQHNVCVFTPSCSHYGLRSVERYGFFLGVLKTSDRLERCNNFAAGYDYPIDPASGKLYDPVENAWQPSALHHQDSHERDTLHQ